MSATIDPDPFRLHFTQLEVMNVEARGHDNNIYHRNGSDNYLYAAIVATVQLWWHKLRPKRYELTPWR